MRHPCRGVENVNGICYRQDLERFYMKVTWGKF